MKCPFCDAEMELGYIQCRDGVTWTPKKQLIAALSAFGKDSIPLQNGSSYNSVHAYKCGMCRKVIIDYSINFNPAK